VARAPPAANRLRCGTCGARKLWWPRSASVGLAPCNCFFVSSGAAPRGPPANQAKHVSRVGRVPPRRPGASGQIRGWAPGTFSALFRKPYFCIVTMGHLQSFSIFRRGPPPPPPRPRPGKPVLAALDQKSVPRVKGQEISYTGPARSPLPRGQAEVDRRQAI